MRCNALPVEPLRLQFYMRMPMPSGLPPIQNPHGVYMTAVGGKPSRTQAPPLEGEGEPHLPAENPHPGGETLHHPQQTFVT